MERAPDAQTGAGGDEVAHAGITPVMGVGWIVHGQGVVISARYPRGMTIRFRAAQPSLRG
jgi:hypothetical protein